MEGDYTIALSKMEGIMITHIIDNVSFNMKESHDFSFLSKYGKVFCVFDQNDSGNISFGTSDGKTRYFIKVAGAKTMQSCSETKETVETLKNAMPIYEALKHPNLIELIDHYELDDLYIAIFKWSDGDCLFDHWNFEKYSNNPLLKSPYKRFKELPIDKRLNSINSIFQFLTYVESMEYVAIDFYDGSIMYDFKNDVTTICDIDFFRKKPNFNDIGENFWGTKRFKSPEEYVYGAVIDGVTNVYTLGALILYFFGKYSNNDIGQMYKNNSFFPCALENWELSKTLYEVSIKAVEKERHKRYNSISDFFASWNEGLCTCRE